DKLVTGVQTCALPISFGPLALRLLWTPGHSPGLLCAWEPERGLLFTSDHLLRSPTPLALYADGPQDPVGEYLEGLDRLARCTARSEERRVGKEGSARG